VDPANSTGTTGIVLIHLTNDRHLWVVEDASLKGRTAEQWSRVAVDLAIPHGAPIIPENDSGGDAIRAVLKAADLLDEVTILPATARGRGGKGPRAEPLALLWERDDYRGHLVGHHPLLEEEMTTYVEGVTTESPDHMDAMVWAGTYLWGRAGFEDVTASFPGTSTANRANSRRPGTMIRWHRGSKRVRT
jgi:phage terminase large subunit-like protein